MRGRTHTAIAALGLAVLAASSASAQDSPLKSVAKIFGFATDPTPAQDFVEKSRPAKEPDYIPIFRPPPEPAKPILNKSQFDALKGDLDSTEKSHDALRARFTPPQPAAADAGALKKKPAVKSTTPKP